MIVKNINNDYVMITPRMIAVALMDAVFSVEQNGVKLAFRVIAIEDESGQSSKVLLRAISIGAPIKV